MNRRWDLRLVPSALTVWLCAVIVLTAGVLPAVWTGLACVGATGALLLVLRRHRHRSSRGAARRASPVRRAEIAGALAVVFLCAAAAVLTAWNATQPARSTLTAHPPGSTVRVTATVTGEPTAYSSRSFAHRGETGEGTVVALQTQRVGRHAEHTEITVFATHPRWAELADGEAITATVTLTDTATPARVTARAAAAPMVAETAGDTERKPGLLEAARADLARLSLSHGAAAAGLVPGMTVGDTSNISASLTEDLRTTGLTHLTAVSGSNCALVMTLTGYAALSLGAGRRVCLVAGLIALGCFVLLVGPDPSVLRASVMGALGALSMLSGRTGVSLNALSAAVIALVLVSPGLAIDFGFILSVLATAGIVVSGRAVARLVALKLPAPVALCIAIPFVAQLWCGPVLLLLNPALPTYSLPANLAATLLVPVVTVAGLIAVCVLVLPRVLMPALLLIPALDAEPVTGAWERAAQLPLTVAAVPARGVAWIATSFAGLPGALTPWPPGIRGIVLLAAISVTAGAGLHWLDARCQRPTDTYGSVLVTPAPAPVPDPVWRRRAAQRRRRRRALAILASVTTLVLLGQGLIWWLRPAPDWDSVVCDVGQGDAVLHRTGEHSAVLVDAGPEPRALGACLRQAEVEHLDAVILSHDHADHTAGLEALTGDIPVDRVWYSSASGDLPESAQDFADRAHLPRPGDTLELGSTTVTVLGPAPPSPARAPRRTVPSSEDENNASLVLRITVRGEHGTTTWLSAGDLEEDGANRLIRGQPDASALKTDILKVSHHGARNGGTRLIDAVDPALAVISVGEDNTYGHPHPAITQALHDRGAAVARTDQHGSLWIRRDGSRISVSTR
ncbi:ComEC/Rec2 family competence protein [Kocuria sp. cx-455]|uniref:ComEC/Rec2 family competence protein n=1 Tax=Kocuria sp. cx-455 TaxID=2771377 RepID=UPI003D7207F8